MYICIYWFIKLYRSCRSEKKVLVTGIFLFGQPWVNSFTEANITGIWLEMFPCGWTSRSVVIGVELPVLPPGYHVSEACLLYNEEWGETAGLVTVRFRGRKRL